MSVLKLSCQVGVYISLIYVLEHDIRSLLSTYYPSSHYHIADILLPGLLQFFGHVASRHRSDKSRNPVRILPE